MELTERLGRRPAASCFRPDRPAGCFQTTG
jgi:hypothetical protein